MSSKLLMTDWLNEPELEAVNALLRGRGFRPIEVPYRVIDVMNSLGPLDAGYWAEVLGLIAQAVEDVRDE